MKLNLVLYSSLDKSSGKYYSSKLCHYKCAIIDKSVSTYLIDLPILIILLGRIMDSNSYLELSLKLQMVPLSLYPVKSLILLMVQGCLRAKLWTPLTVPDFCPQVSCDLFSGRTHSHRTSSFVTAQVVLCQINILFCH